MRERIDRRVRQTNSLNRHELMNDVRIFHKDNNLLNRIEKKELEKKQEHFTKNLNKVTAYYNTSDWTKEYNNGRKIEEFKLQRLQEEKDRDFGKTSKAYKVLEDMYSLKKTLYDVKLDTQQIQTKYYVRIPKTHQFEVDQRRSQSANLQTRKTFMTVLDPDSGNDLDQFKIYDPVHVREIREKLRRNKNLGETFNPNTDLEELTLDQVESKRRKLISEIRDWQTHLSEKRNFYRSQKIEEIRASSDRNLCGKRRKMLSPNNHGTQQLTDKEIVFKSKAYKTESKGFFIKKKLN